MSLKSLLVVIAEEQGGFITESQIETLVALDRLRQVLVRCGQGRFTCPAQNAKHFIELVERGDYVRDVSLLAADDAHKGVYRAHTFGITKEACRQAPPKPTVRKTGPFPKYTFNESDCGGTFDGCCVTSDADPGL